MKWVMLILALACIAYAIGTGCSKNGAPATLPELTENDIPFGTVDQWEVTEDGDFHLKEGVKSDEIPLPVAGAKKSSACGEPCGPLARNKLIRNHTPFIITFDVCSGDVDVPNGELFVLCEDRPKLAVVSFPLFDCQYQGGGVYGNPNCILFHGSYGTLPGGAPVVFWDFTCCGQGG